MFGLSCCIPIVCRKIIQLNPKKQKQIHPKGKSSRRIVKANPCKASIKKDIKVVFPQCLQSYFVCVHP